jgi:hypothetical protein
MGHASKGRPGRGTARLAVRVERIAWTRAVYQQQMGADTLTNIRWPN